MVVEATVRVAEAMDNWVGSLAVVEGAEVRAAMVVSMVEKVVVAMGEGAMVVEMVKAAMAAMRVAARVEAVRA
eukprot:608575-Prymnesium_polylepis.1